MEVCRACLSTEENLVPFEESFVDGFNLLTNLNVTLFDGMPQFLCQTCSGTIKFFIDFREKCILSDTTLKGISLENIKSESKLELKNNKKDTTLVNTKLNACAVIKEEVKDENDDYLELTDCLDGEAVFTNDINFLIKCENPEDVKPKRSRRGRKPTIKVASSQRIRKCKSKLIKIEQLVESIFCGICKKTFEDKDLLFKHLENHKTDRTCYICKELYSDWPQLLAHRITHLPVKDQRCHICLKHYRTSLSLEYHYLKTHYEGHMTKLRCDKCSGMYETPRKLKKHIASVHSEKSFICDYCSRKFSRKESLKKHIFSHEQQKNYVCDLCGFSCNYSGGLKGHKLRKHTPSRCYCRNCKRVFENQEELDKHQPKCTEKTKICPVCGKQFDRYVMYTRHMDSHLKVPRYKCDRCPAMYRSRSSLVVHKNKHDGNRTQQCEYCSAKFFSPTVLIKHRRTHTGEKPYVCKICQRGFTGNHNLKVHMKIHGEMLIVKRNKDPEDIVQVTD